MTIADLLQLIGDVGKTKNDIRDVQKQVFNIMQRVLPIEDAPETGDATFGALIFSENAYVELFDVIRDVEGVELRLIEALKEIEKTIPIG